MMHINIFQGVVLGSLVGASLSLLDKQTRRNSLQSMQKVKSSVTDLDQLTSSVTTTSEKIKTTAEKVSEDVAFILEKVEELKQVTPAIASIVKETKDAFSNRGKEPRKQISSIQYLPEY
ncbi:YtxH domain-containing protein [Niallia sp. NCCP-28]|uniref:YtxH domain-containing protein n=1 Tax=Niallia sp. NCCP-28 TaxID=2934712 RepID=UPI0020C0FE3B|nr:YtxH domain-containing protein [Niallia sp. NCCP-28]